jgi:hypothetical protein
MGRSERIAIGRLSQAGMRISKAVQISREIFVCTAGIQLSLLQFGLHLPLLFGLNAVVIDIGMGQKGCQKKQGEEK